MAALSHKKQPFILVSILILGFSFILSSYSNILSSPGQKIFEQNCQRCHGADGTRGFFGAKNLRESKLTDEGIITQIRTGKGFMPAFKKKFSTEEMALLVAYVKTLRR